MQQAGAVAYVVVLRHAAVHTALQLAQVGQHGIPQVGHLATQVPACALHERHAQSLRACHAGVNMSCTTDSSRTGEHPSAFQVSTLYLLPGVSTPQLGPVHSIASSCA